MGKQTTLSIIKPDAVRNNHIGEIIGMLEKAGLKLVAAKLTRLSPQEGMDFYAIHKERPFYRDLVHFMTSGPVFVMALYGENAIAKNREVMGATDPKKATPGTIRAAFGASIDQNAVHGSDGPDTAQEEIAFFFKPQEIVDVCSR